MNETAIAEKPQVTAGTLARIIYRAGIVKLNECRNKCPGIGGDIDCANLRWLERNNVLDVKAAKQAAGTLESLARSLDIGAGEEVWALRHIGEAAGAEGLLEALKALVDPRIGGDKKAQLAAARQSARSQIAKAEGCAI